MFWQVHEHTVVEVLRFERGALVLSPQLSTIKEPTP